MTPDEARALIAEGRQHDEAMTPGEWAANTDEDYDGEIWQHDLRRLITSVRIVPVAANAQGIAWLRTNLARLLDGYTEALEEIERLKSTQCQACEGRTERLYSDGLMHRCTVCGGTGRKP